MRRLFAVAAVVGLVAGFAAAEDKKPAEKGKLEGTYSIVSGEKDGKAIPKERLDGSVIKITDKAIVGTDKDKKEFYASTYTLDTSKTPWAISMTSTAKKEDAKDKEKKDDAEKGKDVKPEDSKTTASGLVKVDGDTVTLVYALPGGKTPTDFKTDAGQQMFVLKRTEEKKEK